MKFLIAVLVFSNIASATDVVDIALGKFGQTDLRCVVYSHLRTVKDVCPSGIKQVRVNGTPPIPMCGGISGTFVELFSPYWVACLSLTDGKRNTSTCHRLDDGSTGLRDSLGRELILKKLAEKAIETKLCGGPVEVLPEPR